MQEYTFDISLSILNHLGRDSITYKPIRDAMAHTSLLTIEAKEQLKTTYKNIKARLINLLNDLPIENDN